MKDVLSRSKYVPKSLRISKRINVRRAYYIIILHTLDKDFPKINKKRASFIRDSRVITASQSEENFKFD